MYFDFKMLYLGDLEELQCAKKDKYLLSVLVASKKALTRKWLCNSHKWMDWSICAPCAELTC